MPASALKNIHTLEAMCGVRAMRNVALVTTMWNEVPMEVAQRRERYLFEEFWLRMLRDGVEILPFQGLVQICLGDKRQSLAIASLLGLHVRGTCRSE